ncbi:MAG: AAA family ATPase [Coleofasciculaceae cyanobacterium]
MIILCTHNDGGVGKTTLAVHAAGVLISQSVRTLLIDCDDQADFWQFYTDREPSQSNDIDIEDNRTVIFNKNRASIKKLAKPQQYEHVILDIDSPLQNTVQIIVGNDPDLILVPVNKSQKIKALRNLPRTLKVISKLESTVGFAPEVIIVPLGIQKEDISQVVSRINIDNKPQKCKIASAMPDVQEQMQHSIYDDRKYIWDYEGYEDMYEYFCSILGI